MGRSHKKSRAHAYKFDEKMMTENVEEVDRYSDDTSWKSILLYQYNIGYIMFISLTIHASIVIVFAEVIFECIFPTKYGEGVINYESDIIALFDFIYGMDLAFRIIYKLTPWTNQKLYNEESIAESLGIDAFSLVPYEIFYTLIYHDVYMFAMLRLRVMLRLIRLIVLDLYMETYSRTRGTLMVTFRVVCMKLTVSAIITLLHYYLYCTRTDLVEGKCVKHDYKTLMYLYYSALRSTTAAASPEDRFKVEAMLYVDCVCTLFFQTYTFYVVAKIACIKIDKMKAEFTFMHKYTNVMGTYKSWKKSYKSTWTLIDSEIKFTIKNYFTYVLNRRDGILWHESLFAILPEGLSGSITVDIAFNALMHSHIFRDEDDHVLRYLASLIKFEFYIPGEIILKKGQLHGMMIYISHGVIQILSKEDEETPVLSLSGGSCLGESSLFLPKLSNCTLITQTYCEIVILQCQDFRQIMDKYPARYRCMRNTILKRVKKAKRLSAVVQNYLNIKSNKLTRNDLLIMSWIERFKRYIWKPEAVKQDQMMRKDKILHYIDNCVFFVEHMDTLVVPDEIELIKDLVFIKSSFHFILQPESPILLVWDLIVALGIICFLLLFPFFVALASDTFQAGEFYFSGLVFVHYILDVYVQIFTAVKTRGATLTTAHDILMYRAQTFNFIMDCLAAFPLEWVFWLFTGDISPRTYMLCQSNRLLKYYKLVKLANKIKVHMNVSLTTIFLLVQYCTHGIFTLYYITFMFIITNCTSVETCTPSFAQLFENTYAYTKVTKIVSAFTMAFCSVSSLHFGQITVPTDDTCLIYIIVSICFYLFSMRFLSNSICYSALHDIQDLLEQESLSSTIQALKNFEMSKTIHDKIVSYLTQTWYIRKRTFHDETHLSEKLEICYKNIHYLRFFQKTPIFQLLPYDIIATFCSYIKRTTLPPRQIIYYAGDVCNDFCIIEEGFCKLTEGSEVMTVKTAGKHQIIGILDILLKIPHMHTVETASDCIILQVSKNNFESFLCQNPAFREMLDGAMTHYRFQFKDQYSSVDVIDSMKVVNRKFAGQQLIHQTPNEKKKLVLDITCGGYILYWEIARCIIAYVNMIISLYRFHNSHYKYTHMTFLFICDFVSLADIILRFLLPYYDERGIEISDWCKTSVHYLTHGFLLDLLGAFPFDAFFDYEVMFTRVNRAIFIFRIRGLIDHLTDRIMKIRYLFYSAYLLLAVYMFHVLAVANTFVNCTKAGDGRDFVCKESSWIGQSVWKEDILHEDLVNSEAFLLMVSIFNTVGNKKYIISRWGERLTLALWGICGYFLTIIYVSKAVAKVLFMNADLTEYQQAMKNLVVFLSYCKIDKHVKTEVINYFEYTWKTRRGKDVKTVISRIPNALKQDTLYNIYSTSMRSYSIFSKADKSMIKELLMFAEQQTIRKTGILYRVNDVHGTIFYLLKGNVEVIGPDRNRLRTLSPGSLFGCLDNVALVRHTLMMIAKGHVETLSFSSANFHFLLRKYPEFRGLYNYRISFNTDFLAGNYEGSGSNVNPDAVIVESVNCSKIYRPNRVLHGFELALYCIAFFIYGPLEIIFHIARPSIPYLCVLYLHDILWLMRMYMKFRIAYEDEYGNFVYDRKRIAKRYIRAKSGFYIDLAMNVPLDIIPVIFGKAFYIRLFRCNRILRAFHLFNHMSKVIKRLNINVFLTRTFYTLMFLFFYIQVTSAIIYFGESNWMTKPLHIKAAFIVFIRNINTMVDIISGTCNQHTYLYSRGVSLLFAYVIITKVILLTYLYSSFASTLQIVTKTLSKYQEDCVKIERFMHFTETSMAIIDKVSIYLSLLLKIKNGIQFPFLLEEAPYYLREAVLNSMFGFHLRNHPIFKNCHVDFLRQLSATMRTLTFFEHNRVVHKGDNDGCMYFIHEGSINALYEDSLYSERREFNLKAGDCFGLKQILFDHSGHTYTYKVEKFTIVVFIRKADFRRLLKFFPASERHIYEQNSELD